MSSSRRSLSGRRFAAAFLGAAFAVLGSISQSGCAGSPRLRESAAADKRLRTDIYGALSEGSSGEVLGSYVSHFGLPADLASWSLRILPSGIACNVFEPKAQSPRGTVVVVHGYLDDSSVMRGLIRLCLEEGWRTLAPDLPGHGLSGGPRADAEDLGTYAAALDEVVNTFAVAGPTVVVGHSAGGLAALEYARIAENRPSGVFLLAPLVRPRRWSLIRPLSFLASPFVHRIPVEKNAGHFLNGKYLPLSWVRALARRQEAMRDYEPMDLPAFVAYGSREDVIDVRYSVAFLARLFPSARFITVEGAGHYDIAQGSSKIEITEALTDFLSRASSERSE